MACSDRETRFETLACLLEANETLGSLLLNSALTVALAGAVIAGAGYLLQVVARKLYAAWDSHLRRRRALIEFLTQAEFARMNTTEVFDGTLLDALKAAIARDPGFRPYILSSGDDSALLGIQPFRHSFRPSELAVIHTYVEESRLLAAYYDKLASDEFAALPADRKMKVIDNIGTMARRVDRAKERINRIPELQKLRVDHDITRTFRKIMGE